MITAWLFGREFTDICKAELGFSFDHFIVAVEGDMATGFRSDPEVKRFATEATQRIVNEKNYLERIIQTMFEIKAEIEKLFALSPKNALQPEVFKKFVRLRDRFLPYFIIPLRAPDAFSEAGLSQVDVDTLFEKCKVARLATEHFYKEMEQFQQKLFKQAAIKTGINEKLFRTLTPAEFISYLESGSLPQEDILKKRYEYSVVVASPEKNELIVGKEARGIIKRIAGVDASAIKEFKGVIANKGTARGVVRIISTEADMAKFEGGDILVSPMTRPEFLPVMKTSAAYVTDAGGLLCHAAIVARELNKPCIIGTKFATQVLKDGDMVEVDANHGAVRILSHP